MDNFDHQIEAKSRAEFIKEARESCAKNLNPAVKESNKRRPRKPGQTNNKINIFEDEVLHMKPFKKMIIKALCAFAIFVAVVTISSLDTRYDTDYGSKIETWITSDASLVKAEDFFVSILERINR